MDPYLRIGTFIYITQGSKHRAVRCRACLCFGHEYGRCGFQISADSSVYMADFFFFFPRGKYRDVTLSNYGAFPSIIQRYIIRVTDSSVKSVAKLRVFMRAGFTSVFSARHIDNFEDVISSFKCDGRSLWHLWWTGLVHTGLVGRSVNRSHLGDLGVDGKVILKLTSRCGIQRCGLDCSISRQGHVAGAYLCGNDPSGSIKCGEFLD